MLHTSVHRVCRGGSTAAYASTSIGAGASSLTDLCDVHIDQLVEGRRLELVPPHLQTVRAVGADLHESQRKLQLVGLVNTSLGQSNRELRRPTPRRFHALHRRCATPADADGQLVVIAAALDCERGTVPVHGTDQLCWATSPLASLERVKIDAGAIGLKEPGRGAKRLTGRRGRRACE